MCLFKLNSRPLAWVEPQGENSWRSPSDLRQGRPDAPLQIPDPRTHECHTTRYLAPGTGFVGLPLATSDEDNTDTHAFIYSPTRISQLFEPGHLAS